MQQKPSEKGDSKAIIVEHQRLAPSLAQKLGLVASAPKLLDESEWHACEQRSVARGDHSNTCAICRQPFGQRAQVILSCSHVFHRACIESFESFVDVQFQSCPICRTSQYEKRTCFIGLEVYKQACAIMIQKRVRMLASQRELYNRKKELYAKGGGDESMRRKFLAERVFTTTAKLVETVEMREDSLDALFRELDTSIALSKSVFDDSTAPEISSERVMSADAAMSSSAAFSKPSWDQIRKKALSRGPHDCAICMTRMDVGPRRGRFTRFITVLDCSHCFHERCIQSLETFRCNSIPKDEADGAPPPLHTCPMCRSEYTRRPLHECDDVIFSSESYLITR